MSFIDPAKLLSLAGAQRNPYVAKFGYEWTWNVLQVPICREVGQDPIRKCPDGCENGQEAQIVNQLHNEL